MVDLSTISIFSPQLIWRYIISPIDGLESILLDTQTVWVKLLVCRCEWEIPWRYLSGWCHLPPPLNDELYVNQKSTHTQSFDCLALEFFPAVSEYPLGTTSPPYLCQSSSIECNWLTLKQRLSFHPILMTNPPIDLDCRWCSSSCLDIRWGTAVR